MTRQEAIDYLLDPIGKGLKAHDEAISMAVEALKAQEWVPCSERLPEDDERVLVWYEYFRYGDYNCMWQTYGIGYVWRGMWCGDDLQGTKIRCLAWMPLPAPYESEVE